jgi:hypothetical protein
VDWQIRDLRAKAASDMATSKGAQALLGHSAATTTDRYIRGLVGERMTPIMHKITDKVSKYYRHDTIAAHGEMAEWSKAPDSKSGNGQLFGGSNPSLSANPMCRRNDVFPNFLSFAHVA